MAYNSYGGIEPETSHDFSEKVYIVFVIIGAGIFMMVVGTFCGITSVFRFLKRYLWDLPTRKS